MRIGDIRLVGIRCFEDTKVVRCHAKCNVFMGQNNSGKSTFLKAILSLQVTGFTRDDPRPGSVEYSYLTIGLENISSADMLTQRSNQGTSERIVQVLAGNTPSVSQQQLNLNASQAILPGRRPSHAIVPFLARRKAMVFDQRVTSSVQEMMHGTMENLYSRIDLLATYGHPAHDKFRKAVKDIIGLEVTVKSSDNGKIAGFYYNDDKFVTLDQMGDGVAELVNMIVELCSQKNKIFVIEEPETNLHPQVLKSILSMIREASEHNQFFISTHSSIVVRELGGNDCGKIFRVYREGETASAPSRIEEVEHSSIAHIELLRELGYEFGDFNLFDAWLFLEESSAETVFRDVLLPHFAPELHGRLRTFSASGVSNLEPSIAEFQRLVVFVHLQPAYRERLWIRADGDEAGKKAVEAIGSKFDYLDDNHLGTFSRAQFELYYPKEFQQEVRELLEIQDKNELRRRKAGLLRKVLDWTKDNGTGAIEEWKVSAEEPIQLLEGIRKKLLPQRFQ